MKLDVSDALYDSSSVSSDSGASQSSRVSHDFLTSIANSAALPSNVSTIFHDESRRLWPSSGRCTVETGDAMTSSLELESLPRDIAAV